MRNPTRIPRILSGIQGVWSDRSDLRLTQLILNLREPGDPQIAISKLYNMEDDELLDRLKEFYDRA